MPKIGFVILTLEFRREDGYWLGRCRELGTATDGRSLERVKRELLELVELHLNELEEVGERENVFRERRIKLCTDEVLPAQVDGTIPVAAEDDAMVQVRPIAVRLADRDLITV
jgi:predicted RNase H-like HicB family nuclease